MQPASIPLEGPPNTKPNPWVTHAENPKNEFIFGPIDHLNKQYGVHRDRQIHKLEPRMLVYARKLRQMYYREGTIQTEKTFIDPLRLRGPEDTI